MTTAAQMAAFTTLDGGAGRDTLMLNASQLNTTAALKNTAFEIIGVGTGLTGNVDASMLGSGVDTIQLFGAAGGATVIDNAFSGFTLADWDFRKFKELHRQGFVRDN